MPGLPSDTVEGIEMSEGADQDRVREDAYHAYLISTPARSMGSPTELRERAAFMGGYDAATRAQAEEIAKLDDLVKDRAGLLQGVVRERNEARVALAKQAVTLARVRDGLLEAHNDLGNPRGDLAEELKAIVSVRQRLWELMVVVHGAAPGEIKGE